MERIKVVNPKQIMLPFNHVKNREWVHNQICECTSLRPCRILENICQKAGKKVNTRRCNAKQWTPRSIVMKMVVCPLIFLVKLQVIKPNACKSQGAQVKRCVLQRQTPEPKICIVIVVNFVTDPFIALSAHSLKLINIIKKS